MGSYSFAVAGPSSTAQFDSLGLGVGASASVGTLASAPPASSVVNTAFGNIAVGVAKQNTLGYDILVSVSIVVTAATGATFSAGVGSTSTPTTAALVAAFSAAGTFEFTFKVPDQYYLLLTDGGTITLGSTTTWSQAA